MKRCATPSTNWPSRHLPGSNGKVSPDWFDLYGQRISNYLLPRQESKRQAWAERVGTDGIFLLEQIYLSGQHPELVEIPAVDILRQVWIQNFYEDAGQVRLRQQKDQPPSARRIASLYDLEARLSSKRETTWIGYKVPLTETCMTDAPNLITNVETRPSMEPDRCPTMLPYGHAHCMACRLSPTRHPNTTRPLLRSWKSCQKDRPEYCSASSTAPDY